MNQVSGLDTPSWSILKTYLTAPLFRGVGRYRDCKEDKENSELQHDDWECEEEGETGAFTVSEVWDTCLEDWVADDTYIDFQ